MMVAFLDLPQELRDQVYEEVLLGLRTRPTLGGEKFMVYDPHSRFKKIYEPQSSLRGEFGCGYALDALPSTCAAFLASNRQIHAEMKDTVLRLDKKGLVNARLDCIAEDESFHYFTWLGIPLVMTKGVQHQSIKTGILPEYVEELIARALAGPLRMLGQAERFTCRSSTTQIGRLWVDVRIVGNRLNKWHRNNNPGDRTGWAICAALKRLFDKGPYLPSERDQPSTRVVTVDELVLNVVPPPSGAKMLEEDYPLDEVKEGTVHPRTVAKELANVWSKIWAGEDFKGYLFMGLLERIGWVRVCVDGETYRLRELRGALERGRKERQKIRERIGV